MSPVGSSGPHLRLSPTLSVPDCFSRHFVTETAEVPAHCERVVSSISCYKQANSLNVGESRKIRPLIGIYSLRLVLTFLDCHAYTYPMKFPEMFTMQGEKEYLTLQEAMQYLNVSRATIFNYVKRGLIKRYERQVPHEILYKKSELENLKKIKPKE